LGDEQIGESAHLIWVQEAVQPRRFCQIPSGKICFKDFMQSLKPRLNDDYIHKAHFDDKGNFILMFADGGQKVYRVDDCTSAQLKDAIEMMKKNGVPVFKAFGQRP
jgi:hypothetical protein